MEPEFVQKLVEVYGPLALGWPLFLVTLYAWIKDRNHLQKIHREDMANVAAILKANGETINRIREVLARMLERLRMT